MRIKENSDFDREPEALMALITDRDYFLRKYSNLGADRIEVEECVDDGDRFAITVRQRVPQNTPLPGFIRRLVGDRIAITQTDIWQRSQRRGRIDIVVASAPVAIAVDLQLAPRPGGSRLALAFDIDARVPLLGGRVEQFLAGDIVQRMRDDLDETRRLLAERKSA